jgi:hypothetical protein
VDALARAFEAFFNSLAAAWASPAATASRTLRICERSLDLAAKFAVRRLRDCRCLFNADGWFATLRPPNLVSRGN